MLLTRIYKHKNKMNKLMDMTVSLALFLSLSLLSFDLLKLEKWAWSILVAAPFALLDPQIILFTSIIQK